MNIIPKDEAALCRIYCKDYDQEWFEFYENKEFKYVNHVPLNFIDRLKYVFYMLDKSKQVINGEKIIAMAVPVNFAELELLVKTYNIEPQDIDVKSVLIPSESNEYYSHRIFFQSKSGLAISAILNHVNEVESINLGYVFEKKDISELKKQVFSYILFSKGNYFCEYKNILSDSDSKEFISVIAYLHKYIKNDHGKLIYANKY